MKFWSENFGDFQPMPADYTADGQNKPPTFVIKDVPASAKKLVLICHDPDATGGKIWTHWLVWNIPPDAEKITEGMLPKSAMEGFSSFGAKGYGGPNPTPGSGPHRYVFSLYALDKNVGINADSTRDEILRTIAGSVCAQSVWTGIYEHPSK